MAVIKQKTIKNNGRKLSIKLKKLSEAFQASTGSSLDSGDVFVVEDSNGRRLSEPLKTKSTGLKEFKRVVREMSDSFSSNTTGRSGFNLDAFTLSSDNELI